MHRIMMKTICGKLRCRRVHVESQKSLSDCKRLALLRCLLFRPAHARLFQVHTSNANKHASCRPTVLSSCSPSPGASRESFHAAVERLHPELQRSSFCCGCKPSSTLDAHFDGHMPHRHAADLLRVVFCDVQGVTVHASGCIVHPLHASHR